MKVFFFEDLRRSGGGSSVAMTESIYDNMPKERRKKTLGMLGGHCCSISAVPTWRTVFEFFCSDR